MPSRSLTVQAVLFDMDGTLIDSTPAVARSWRTWSTRWGLDDVFAKHEHGKPARQIVADNLPADRVDEAFASIEAIEVADTDGVVPMPGAVALLDALPADRWAIVTSCSAPLAAARLAATGLRPPVLVTASDTVLGKPNPDPFLLAAERLGFDPQTCLVVEDAAAGLLAGRRAGCATLGVAGTLPIGELDADLVAPAIGAVRIAAGPDGLEVSVADAG